ncbi:MAG: hypothetical protein AAF382_13490 [Pseudomonadota bacterium]
MHQFDIRSRFNGLSDRNMGLIAARAAARSYPLITRIARARPNSEQLALLTGRLILTSVVANQSSSPTLQHAASNAVKSVFNCQDGTNDAACRNAVQAAMFAAEAITFEADAASYAKDSVTKAAEAIEATSADAAGETAFEEALNDINFDFKVLFKTPIWQGSKQPDWLTNALSDRSSKVDDGPAWEFWKAWYTGLLTGEHVSWEVQHMVALIDEERWEAGPAAVAAEIERIEANFNREPSGSDRRAVENGRPSATKLFENKAIGLASCAHVQHEITRAQEAFFSETGLNQLPETFATLPAISVSLGKIGAVLVLKDLSEENEQKLHDEVRRLNARIVELENELEKARNSKKPIFLPQLKKQIATSIGDWKLYAAICGGLWFISGDDVEMQKRLSNLLELREAVCGDDSPTPAP